MQLARPDSVLRDRLAHARAHPALRAVAASVAIAGVVAGIGTAAASGSASGAGAAQPGLITSVTTVAPDSAAAAVLAAARTHLGQKYAYGGSGPATWDCSGLTSSLWSTLGGVTAIPRTARLQQAWAIPVPAAQVLPGDLYFLGTPATHVGLVVGNGLVLDASASAGKVVLRQLWTSTDITFGRVPRASAVPVIAPPPVTPTTAPATTAPVPTAPVTTAPATTAPATTAPTAPVVKPPVTTAPAVVTPPVVTPPVTAPPVAAPLSSATRGFITDAERLVGARYQSGGVGPAYDDGALVAAAWGQARDGILPLDRNALAARTRPVLVTNLRPGDLVIYGTTDVWHIGIYVGHGKMVDSSRIMGHVVLRRLFTSPDRHFGRLS